MKKIALAGGAPETLCDTTTYHGGGAWNREGVILIGGAETGIRRVAANGGVVSEVTSLDVARGDKTHWAPTFLPDGHHFLYWVDNSDLAKSGIYLTSLEGGENRQLLLTDAKNVGVAMNSADQNMGYLTFVRQGVLLAQSFDFRRNQLVGNPVRIVEHVAAAPNISRWANYSLATNGVLIALEREIEDQLTWFDRTGKKLGMVSSAGRYTDPILSPDGLRFAVGRLNSATQTEDIHLFDSASGAGTPFTFDPAKDQQPIWSPDGSRIIWASTREGVQNLFQKAASGAGQDEVLLRSPYQKFACDWSKDGRFILYMEMNPQTSFDLWVLPLEGERQLWLNAPASQWNGSFSPDGKWIAYTSNESGRNEIYLQPFVPGAAAAGGKRQLSPNGGEVPQWRRDGRELYYLSLDGKIMVVPITPGAELKAGAAQELFTPGQRAKAGGGYTVTGDGQRFLVVTSAEDVSLPPFTVVLNWMAEMKK